MQKITTFLICLATVVLSSFILRAQDKEHLALESPFASFVEKEFPFFSQTLDARHLEGNWPGNNLTPRGIILKLGQGYFACFDTDLLRIALVWKENKDGEYLTMTGMAPGSYRLPNRKAPAGQESLPRPIGTPLAATGIYPGWYVGDKKPDLKDHRERSVDPAEVGLGPLSPKTGRWLGIRLHQNGVILEYEIGGVKIQDQIGLEAKSGVVTRRIALPPHDKVLTMVNPGKDGTPELRKFLPNDQGIQEVTALPGGGSKYSGETPPPITGKPAGPIWKESITTQKTKTSPVQSRGAFSVDEVTLPLNNPWKRNVRLSAFDFFSDGRAAFCTFDGDVWIVNGLSGHLDQVVWKRFASGLHEPIGLEISRDQIYVFDRNGIIRLQDENGDGEADFYQNFSNVVAQTAETREFANDIYEKPGGGFYLAKGGQVGSTRGKYNGTVISIAKDGQSFEVLATGFRMPYIGVDPKTGRVTASDQQGNWVPATPIHVVEKREYYGFQPAKFKNKAIHPKPIDEPEIWIPHFVNESGASQIWLRHAKMGPLNDSLIHVGFSRPEIFKIYLDDYGKLRQGAVASILEGFPSGIMKPRIHPVDGTLWLTGFKIWGTSAGQISGLYRVRYNGKPCWVPERMRSFDKGVILRFSQPVDREIAGNLANYTVDRWNYLRQSSYGSGHYRLNGEPGQETLPVASVTLSKDKRSVLLGIPNMKPVHTLQVSYRRPEKPVDPAALPMIQHAYFTVSMLNPLDLKKEGFDIDQVDLTLKAGSAGQPTNLPEPSIAIGKETATKYGCVVCHTSDGSKIPAATAKVAGAQVAVGPTWKDLWGARREFSDGSIIKSADATYLRESIVDPGRRIIKGFEIEKSGVGMPPYLGVLKDYEIDSLILYIKSLGRKGRKQR